MANLTKQDFNHKEDTITDALKLNEKCDDLTESLLKNHFKQKTAISELLIDVIDKVRELEYGTLTGEQKYSDYERQLIYTAFTVGRAREEARSRRGSSFPMSGGIIMGPDGIEGKIIEIKEGDNPQDVIMKTLDDFFKHVKKSREDGEANTDSDKKE